MILTMKCIGDNFCNKNALEMIFAIKCIGHDFYHKMHWK